jgi:hypothetical protein
MAGPQDLAAVQWLEVLAMSPDSMQALDLTPMNKTEVRVPVHGTSREIRSFLTSDQYEAESFYDPLPG